MTEFNDLIEKIISIEWNMFQKVHNIGGRASCQDDWKTFYIMRGSQFTCWTDKMKELYLAHLEKAEKECRNLVMEKYGRMMEYTDPEYYEKEIKPYVPVISIHSMKKIEEIMSILLPWEKEFAEKYPKIASAGRPTIDEGDGGGLTSLEIYEKGELCTYSEALLDAYLGHIKNLKSEGKSISSMEREIIVSMYGYADIDSAEAAIG